MIRRTSISDLHYLKQNQKEEMRKMSETITEEEWTELKKEFSYNSMTLYGDKAHYQGTNATNSSEEEPV